MKQQLHLDSLHCIEMGVSSIQIHTITGYPILSMLQQISCKTITFWSWRLIFV